VTHHQDLVYRVAWSPDGARFATAGADGLCQVAARDSGNVLATYRGHSKAVLAIAYLPDGKSIVSAGVDQTVRLWDAATGQHQRTLDNHVGAVSDIAVRPVASMDSPPVVASIGEDRTTRLWQPTVGRLMRFARLPSPPRALAWTPDGQRLIVGCSDGQMRVVDWETAQIIAELRALSGRIHAIAVDPRSRRILAAGEGEPVSVEF
jgi:WD40 repeat protein